MRNTFLRPVIQTLLSVLLVIAVPVTVLLFGLKTTVYNEEIYHRIPESETFIHGILPFVEDSLEAECLFYDIPFDTVRTAVTDDWLRELSREYTQNVYAALCSGEEVAAINVSPEPYRTVLETYFASLPENERPLDKNVADTLAKEFAKVTSSALSSGLINRVLNYGHAFVYGDTLLRRLSAYATPALLITLLLFAVNLIPWGGFRKRCYAAAGSLFVGSALVFVPLWLLKRYHLSSHLALGDSPLKLYVSGIVDGMTNGFFRLSLIVFLCALVLLVASVVPVVSKKEKQYD